MAVTKRRVMARKRIARVGQRFQFFEFVHEERGLRTMPITRNSYAQLFRSSTAGRSRRRGGNLCL
jgi:hypothetical protein